ncbi:hypothetical protein [Lamprocystis purpurea]|uniref:hypothetical protein n=1 Tax=Lamprocystis purpurea TaxID=61598 RepID=UPI00146B4BC9|nr:hypothetical protein [Lamprocystis purpurea]
MIHTVSGCASVAVPCGDLPNAAVAAEQGILACYAAPGPTAQENDDLATCL